MSKKTVYQQFPIPPYAKKLLRQLTEAIRQSSSEIFDPSWSKDATIDIQITIPEARAIVELDEWINEHKGFPSRGKTRGFLQYTSDGRLNEDNNEH